MFVSVLSTTRQSLSESRTFPDIAAVGDGSSQGAGECLVGASADQVFRGGAGEAGTAAAIDGQLGVGTLQTQVFDDLP